jgi:DNA-directed RNA polymerase specialized sigma24 family protein
MDDLTLDQALPKIQDLADRKASAFVRRCGIGADEREDVRSQLLLSFLTRWPKYNHERASIQTFASRVMDKELTTILRYRLAASRREREIPVLGPSLPAAVRGGFRIDLARALAGLPASVRDTALTLLWHSNVEAAEKLGCSRQIIHQRKQQIRTALESAGIGPRYFAAGGSL